MLRSVTRSASKAGLFGRRGMLLARADRKRDERSWQAAAALYREYLELKPGDWAIWVQLGHALKELGRLAEAEAAYLRAVRLEPDVADIHLQLGHVLKLSGRIDAAKSAYARAAALDPACEDARIEMRSLAGEPMSPDSPTDQACVRRARPTLGATDRDGLADTMFDVSDLVAYFQAARQPTGIQRVQIEIIASLLRGAHERSGTIGVCAFAETCDWWVQIPDALFLDAADLASTGGGTTDAGWLDTTGKIQALLQEARPMPFRTGAALVNLGTSWWMANYLLAVRNAKADYDIRYIPFVHDLIPIVAPQYCVAGLPEEFIAWACDVFEHADRFLVNSQSTRRDLLAVGERLGRHVAGETITVVPLDADFRRVPSSGAAPQMLEMWGLEAEGYVLFVSTIEARKNHLGAFSAWLALLERHGAETTPKLVCAGKPGWMDEDALAKLEASDLLKSHVVILPSLSDGDLALLYENSLFTLYPSHYEGWGLPVTESLCYGKVPLISTAASLPEAGGTFAEYFQTGSVAAMVEALERLIFDEAHRRTRAQKIRETFRPRSWQEIGAQVLEAASRAREPSMIRRAWTPPVAEIGVYYPLKRKRDARIVPRARTNEIFRAGRNWRTSDDRAAWTKPGGSRIDLRVAGAHGPLRAYFGIEGAGGLACRCRLEFQTAGGPASVERLLTPGEKAWLACEFPPIGRDDTIGLTLYSDRSQDTAEGEDAGPPSIGLIGFYLCEAQDLVARTDFLEAILAGDLSRMEASVQVQND